MRKSLVSLAAMGAFLAMAPGGLSYSLPTPQINVSSKKKRALFNGAVYSSGLAHGRKSAGILMAQQQRASKKARNVRRHKRSAKR